LLLGQLHEFFLPTRIELHTEWRRMHGKCRMLLAIVQQWRLRTSLHGRWPAMLHGWPMLLEKLHEFHVSENVQSRWGRLRIERRMLLARLFEWRLQTRRQLHRQWPILRQRCAVLFAKVHELHVPALMLIQ
jgi:hypothetical protein